MLYFCEECGQKLNVDTSHEHAKHRRYSCSGCGERLTVMDDQTAALDCPEDSLADSKGDSPGKILVVDDSAMIRKALGQILEAENSLKVVGEAANGEEALEMMPELNPDAVTLDVNMPVMDGLTTLKHMMIKTPRPTVMISTLTVEGATVTFDALKYGAVDFIPKPSQRSGQLEEQKKDIVRKVFLASRMETGAIRFLRSSVRKESDGAPQMAKPEQIFCFGAAEGGYGALMKIVTQLRPDFPAAVLIVLYAEPGHVDAFSKYLDAQSKIRVRRAKDRGALLSGFCYVASGDEYLTLDEHEGRLMLRLNPNPFPGRRGAINMLMMSAAETFGDKASGALLSGAGEDGLEGLREIMRQGGFGAVQEPRSCLCRDMAAAAICNLQVDLIIPDYEMAQEINAILT